MSGDLDARVEALEDEGRFDEAIALLEAEGGAEGRFHVAWLLVRAGRLDEARRRWDALRAERPDDPGVPYLEGAALLEADDPVGASGALGEALALALRVGSDGPTLRRIVGDRDQALRRSGLPFAEIDETARLALARAAAQGVDAPVVVPWFDRDEFPRALDAWPGFAADWRHDGHRAYSHALDERMRAASSGAPRRPVVAALTVAEVEAFAAGHGLEADWAETRSRAAYEAAAAGRGTPWPPGRNDPCWCGSGSKYKRCCGR